MCTWLHARADGGRGLWAVERDVRATPRRPVRDIEALRRQAASVERRALGVERRQEFARAQVSGAA